MEDDEEDFDQIIEDIGNGKFGTSEKVVANLNRKSEGLYERVEERMIENFSDKTIEELVNDVIGKMYGNGDERALKLGPMYNIVQNKVNEEFGYTKRRELNEKHIEILANRTIEGEFGNGMEKK